MENGIIQPNTRIRSLLLILIFTFVASGVVLAILSQIQAYNREQLYLATEAALPKHQVSVKKFASSELGISFSYATKLTLLKSQDEVVLSHQIPYKNSGDCDMKGGGESFDYLTDFRASFTVFKGTMAEAVKKISPYMPSENYLGDTLKISPGFIDSYRIGSLNGFAILEGAEGCGHTIYYFPISGNRVLVVERANIQALSTIITKEKRDEVLAVPGVITLEENEKLFKQILGSAALFPPQDVGRGGGEVDTANWKTYRNEEYGFEIKYPNNWKVKVEDVYDGVVFNSQIRCINFVAPDEKYYLVFGIRDKTENVKLCPRTGVGAGEPMFYDKVKIGDYTVNSSYLNYQDKAKELYLTTKNIQAPSSEVDYENKKMLAEFSSGEMSSSEWNSLDLREVVETAQAIAILSTFKFIK